MTGWDRRLLLPWVWTYYWWHRTIVVSYSCSATNWAVFAGGQDDCATACHVLAMYAMPPTFRACHVVYYFGTFTAPTGPYFVDVSTAASPIVGHLTPPWILNTRY